jgi:thiamine-monophosphate kinase
MRERDLIARIRSHNPALSGVPGLDVPVPPGDDMALVRFGDGHVLVAADQVIEGRHFLRGTDLDLVARKAVARNVSDVAAMAAIPRATVATAALPRGMADRDVEALADGLRRWAAHWGCPMVGGDVGVQAADGPLVVSVSILAQPGPGGRVVTRAGAMAGDLLCVTGALGGSLSSDGRGRHLTFEPRVPQALALAAVLGGRLHAMIDVSDGLARDAGHLADAEGLAVEVDAACVPCAPGSSWQGALGDGEDHELAFACAGAPPAAVEGVPVTVIGRFVMRAPGAPLVVAIEGPRRIPADDAGWEHRT